MKLISDSTDAGRARSRPWLQLLSFLLTVVIATVEHWSAADLVWSFWLAGLLLGCIYLAVYQVAQGDRETLLVYPLALCFFYMIFALFFYTIFAFALWDAAGEDAPSLFVAVPAAITHAALQRWPFLLFSGVTLLPDYILDARTVHFTDVSKPLFTRDMLRMIILIFLLMGLTLLQLGVFALYPVLFIYFFPIRSLRQIITSVFGAKGRRH